MDGTIFDIQRFCIHDGPGIRTTIFFKGCPLHCIWCHNPESQKMAAGLAYYADKCLSCGACVEVCSAHCHVLLDDEHRLDRRKCICCGKCASACPVGALELLGKAESVENILSEVLRDKLFYEKSGGGITVSGGEPLMQRAFLIALLKRAKEEGLHTCIETCGYASRETVIETANYTDIFLYDIKETDNERHKALTGVPFTPIKENLLLLDSLGSNSILRCPLIPDINTREEHFREIAAIAASLNNLLEINIMAYHLLGNSKYDALSMENPLRSHEAMTAAQKEDCIQKIRGAIKEICGKDIRVT